MTEAPNIEIHAKIYGRGERGSTMWYRKFVAVEGKIIGELVPCEYDKMRAKEVL